MRQQFSPLHFLIFFFLVFIIAILIQIEIFSFVLHKLGLSPGSAVVLLIATLIGSTINLPLFTLHSEMPEQTHLPAIPRWIFGQVQPFYGKTVIAINVGGALIPTGFSLYLIYINTFPLITIIAAVSIVSLICHLFSRPIKGLGIGMPIFIAPVTAALTAILIAPESSAPLAYICGTLGVLIGADLLRLKDIKKLHAPLASIGGAGTFDGIFFTGIVAVLLA